MSLDEAERARFSRQLVLPGFSLIAQERLGAARVHLLGPPEVTGPASIYLAMAGVGTLLIDDAADVVPEDASGWLYPPAEVGQPRAFVAASALRELSAFSRARPYSSGSVPTAAIVAASAAGAAREAAERMRRARVPHVVAVPEGEGGEVVTVPLGAPCYACGSRPGAGARPSLSAPAALGTLAALELLLMLALQGREGRRVELLDAPRGRPTARLPGCPCGEGP